MINRKIKFRAYDTINKKFTDSGIYLSNTTLELDSIVGINIMQFTGLKDGGGNDIYENDFVKFRPNYTDKPTGETVGLIVFYDNQWMLQANDCYYSISEETDEFYCYSEIVGNIYENPQ